MAAISAHERHGRAQATPQRQRPRCPRRHQTPVRTATSICRPQILAQRDFINEDGIVRISPVSVGAREPEIHGPGVSISAEPSCQIAGPFGPRSSRHWSMLTGGRNRVKAKGACTRRRVRRSAQWARAGSLIARVRDFMTARLPLAQLMATSASTGWRMRRPARSISVTPWLNLVLR